MAIRTLSSLRTAALVAAATACALATPAEAQTTLRSSPVGVMVEDVPRGDSGLALPLIARELFVGVVASHEGAVLVFPGSAGDVGSLLSADGKYYVEVVTGLLEGERFDVDAPATVAAADARVVLLFGAGSSSTLPALAANTLAGARCVIRPHTTLATLQTMFTPGLVGSDDFLLADSVQLAEGGEHRIYHLRADGASWARVGSSGDHRDKVLPPDVSVLVNVRSGQRWLHAGKVRVNAFRKNLDVGYQSFATGFPLDLSPAQVGAFVDPGAPAATRWTGHNNVDLADQFHVLSSPRPLTSYFLRGNGTTWRPVNHSNNVADQPILGATSMIVLRRVKPDPAYRIPRPFGL